MAKYTEKQKTAVLARVAEIGVSAAAKEAGIPVTTVSKWNKAAAVAETIVADAKAENKKAIKQARQEKADATKIEVKKKTRSAGRKTKEKTEKAKAAVKKSVKKARTAKMDLFFETSDGLQIKPEDVVEKVPKGCDAAYVKLEENKIYWVKGEETGDCDIW